MSTRGCIGLKADEKLHLIYNHSDSYPECLGQRLVEQIQAADLSRWKQVARVLRPTEKWDGPDFRLTEDEITHILTWVANCVTVDTFIEPDKDDGLIRVCASAETGLFEYGDELAAVLKPTLQHEPATFFDTITGRVNAILELGLYPRLSPRFLKSPFCEWFYLIDFDEGRFRVGSAAYDLTREPGSYGIGFWAEPEDDDDIEFRQYANFPLDDIPADWEDQLEDVVNKEGKVFAMAAHEHGIALGDKEAITRFVGEYNRHVNQAVRYELAEEGSGLLVAPIVNKGGKVGRNEPCRCGSGKKYKKCCGR